MRANHVHVGVRDLPAAVGWLERVWELKPVFQIPQMAIFAVGEFELFLDAGDHDSRPRSDLSATIAIATTAASSRVARRP